MSDTVEVNDETYVLTDDPSLGTVRDVQQMQASLIRDYLSEDDLRELDDLESDGEIIQLVMDNHGYSAVEDLMWDHSLLESRQTISLACDTTFDSDDFNDMGSKEFQEVREKAEDLLGGNATDFFETLGIGTLLTEEAVNRSQ